MAVLNAYNCLTVGNKNTGIPDCSLDISEIYGLILIPSGKTFSAMDLTTLKTTLVTAATDPDKTKRIYPIGTFVDVEDNSEEPTLNTTNYGVETETRDGMYKWTFMYNNGLCFQKSVMSFRGQHRRFDVLLVDKKGMIIGVGLPDGGLKGLKLNRLYPENAPIPNGNDPVWYRLAINLANSDEFNNKLGYVYDPEFNPLDEVLGMLDVELKKVSITSSDVVVSVKGNCGAVDLSEVFADDLNDVAMWVVKNASTGLSMSLTSVTKVSGGFELTPTSTPTGIKATISLAAPSVLEGGGIVSPSGNLMESNTIEVEFP